MSKNPHVATAAFLPDEDKGDYKAKLEAWEVKAAKANAIPVPMISGRLMMIVENDNDLAKIWSA